MIDYYGNFIGLSLIFFIYISIMFKLSAARLLTNKLILIITVSLIVHIIALNFYALFPSDSSGFYFPNASFNSFRFGSEMAIFISAALKEIGFNSLLSQFYFSNSIGLLASYFYFMSYSLLAKECAMTRKEYDNAPAFTLIWLWPSFIFWPTGIGKDSFMFLGIAMMLYGLQIYKYNKLKFIILNLISFVILWMLRPQIFISIFFSFLLLTFFSRKMSLKLRIFIVILFTYFIFQIFPIILHYGGINSYDKIAEKALKQQMILSTGTSISVAHTDPMHVFLFLPYTACANLFLPLFLGTRNLIGIFASFENVILIYLIYFYLRYRKETFFFAPLKTKQFLKYLELYFICGILFLGILNTNLGLAMRQKIMFTAPFFILIALSFVLNKKYKILKANSKHEGDTFTFN